MSVQSTGHNPSPTRREQRRNQLLDTALELFGEVGFERATIKALAGRASVSQGLLYHYFQSKEELIAAVMERYSLIPRFEELYRSLAQSSAAEALPRIAAETLRLFWEQRDVCWLFFREIKNPAIAAPMEGMRHENIRLLANYLQSRVAAGELRPHDCTVTARTLLSALFIQTILPPHPRETELLAGLTDLLLQGVRSR